MTDKEKVIKGLELCTERFCDSDCPYYRRSPMIGGTCTTALLADALALLKEQEDLKQKIWNALYAEEDKLEKKFIRTEEHNDWFAVYRPWLQRGFEIAIKVIAEQDGR